MSAASSAVTPSLGMTLPGSIVCGERIQASRFSGVLGRRPATVWRSP